MENSIEHREFTRNTQEMLAKVEAMRAKQAEKQLPDTEVASSDKARKQINQPQSAIADNINQSSHQDIMVEPDTEKKAKAIFSREGYSLPDHVRTKYHVRDGKFHDHSTDILRFEDKGKSLATVVEDKTVIRDMLAIATSKNWEAIEIKGTENFKQQAWLEARTLGFDVKGYEPNQHDLDALAKRLPENQMSFTDKQPESVKLAPALSQAQISVEVARRLLESALVKHSEKDRADIMQQFMQEVKSGNIDLPTPVTIDKTASMQRENEGILLAYGNANYENNPKNKHSYYVKINTVDGEKTLWGVDLQRAIGDSKVRVGDRISLEKTGAIPVTVQEKVRDETGKVVGVADVATNRNEWEVQKIKPETNKQKETSKEIEVER